MQGGIDAGDYRFPPQVVGDVYVRNNILPADGTLPSPGAAEPRRWPDE